MRRARPLALLALVSVTAPLLTPARADVLRYGEPSPPTTTPPLVTRLHALVAETARKQHRAPPKPDARLDAAAVDIAKLTADRPPNELVQGAVWLHGIVEPPPFLLLASYTPGADEPFLQQLGADLAAPLAAERYARVGVGLAPQSDGTTRVLLALQESFIELEPVARALPLAAHVTLRGQLHAGFVHPEAFVTAPDGRELVRMALAGAHGHFDGGFTCGPKRGRYQIEVTGDDRFGATVLANFPVWCGEPAPTALTALAPPSARDEASATPAQAEKSALALLNADRAHAGLPPLAWDDALANVARGHSQDMAQHGFFGHVSPTTGSASDRVRRANIDTLLILENVARALTAGESERGLMNSPGHRANILNREVTHVGIGVAVDRDEHGLLVTQLFSRPPARFSAGNIDDVWRNLVELRRHGKLPALERVPALDELATTTARDMAKGLGAAQAGKRIADALQRESKQWRSARSVFAVVGEAAQLVPSVKDSLGDASVTHVGIGLVPGKRKDGGNGLYAVLILATAR